MFSPRFSCRWIPSNLMLPTAILAGGLATRLRPLTEKVPKALLTVAGEPFIFHQLRLLRDNGVRLVVLCLGFLGEQVEQAVGDGSAFGLEVRYSYDGPTLRGTAGALDQALPLLPQDSPFFVLYGDSYLPTAFEPVGRHFLDSGKLALMTVFKNASLYDTSNVVFAEGEILKYDKKQRTEDMQYIDYGLGAFRHAAFAAGPPAGAAQWDLAVLYQTLLAQNQLAAYEIHERFYEIGSHQGLQELDQLLAKP